MSRFSIIVPVYNVENYLDECVKSVLGQSFSDFELILVNDGSKDGSGSLCDRLAAEDSRIRVIHQENQGLSGARNTGINDPQNAKLPAMEALQAAAGHCSFDSVMIDPEASTVYITDPDTRLDVGAIAKGWATQRAAENAPPECC